MKEVQLADTYKELKKNGITLKINWITSTVEAVCAPMADVLTSTSGLWPSGQALIASCAPQPRVSGLQPSSGSDANPCNTAIVSDMLRPELLWSALLH